MAHGVVEEHQVHSLGGELLVVVAEEFVASGLELLKVVDSFVDLFSIDFDLSVFVLLVFSEEVNEVDGGFLLELVEDFGFELSEGFEGDFVDVVLDLVFLLDVGEFVHEDSFGLVSPQSYQKDFGFEAESASG